MNALPVHVNCCAEARWIEAETGIPAEVAHRVLIYDMRYLEMLGIAHGPPVENHEIQPIGSGLQ
jgi:hypothetical protein